MCKAYTRFLFIVALLTTTTGCGVFYKAPEIASCVKESQKTMTVAWGTMDSTQVVHYTLNTRGQVFRRVQKMMGIGMAVAIVKDSNRVVDIPSEQYCSVLTDVQSTFLKAQAVSVRGVRGRYIDISNLATSVYLRAMWNPDLETFQSRDVRKQFDELMELIPKED